jgi:hypothetical protein
MLQPITKQALLEMNFRALVADSQSRGTPSEESPQLIGEVIREGRIR